MGSWYEWVEPSDDLWQGQFIDDFDLHSPTYASQGGEAVVARTQQRIVTLTQSCDLVAGIEDTRSVLIAPVTEVPSNIKKSTVESIAKFRKHIFYPLQRDDDFKIGFTIIRLDAIQVAPLGHLRSVVKGKKTFRLQSNYVEHLSHFVGIFISRVALPDDALDRLGFISAAKGQGDESKITAPQSTVAPPTIGEALSKPVFGEVVPRGERT